MPHRIAISFGRFAGRLTRLLLWRKTDLCEARCVMSLGVGITIAREIIRGSFVNLGMSAVEFIRLPAMKSRINELVAFPRESIDVLREALSRGKGVILMVSHCANWEYAAARVIHEGFPLHAVYTPQSDKAVENVIMNTREKVSGMAMIDSNKGLREIFRVLKAGGIVVIMQDLDARKDGVMSDFLGMPASTHDGVVKLYRRFGCPVVPARVIRDMDNPLHHTVNMPGILSDCRDKNGLPFGEDMKASLEMCNDLIASWIKARPELWLWLLDRWQYTLGKEV
ncbi:MAG: lysophospholipid acyltransferase family protein [Synergistaceae bacterium]|nr:lysophospholipid acyltransferase family protein [Synergistaceae bacterium]